MELKMKITSSFLQSERPSTKQWNSHSFVVSSCFFRCSSVSSLFPFLRAKPEAVFFPYLLVGPAPKSQHGGERGGAGYSSEGVDQTAGSPTSQSSGAGSLLCAHPVCWWVFSLLATVQRHRGIQWCLKELKYGGETLQVSCKQDCS